MYGTRDINTTKINCICASDPQCQGPAIIYDTGLSSGDNYVVSVGYMVPGFSTGCSALESLRRSTLECLYVTSNCFFILADYIRLADIYTNENPAWLSFRRLVYDSKLSRYPPNSSIAAILSKAMIERLDSAISYEQFYQFCAPSHCSYAAKIHTKTGLGMVLTIISAIGGVRAVLRLVMPHLVKLLINLFTKRKQEQRRQGN